LGRRIFMTPIRSSVKGSVRTVTSARSSSPFRRGTVRDRAYFFLQKARTSVEFYRWARRLGINAQNLLRTLRSRGYLQEENDLLRWTGDREWAEVVEQKKS